MRSTTVCRGVTCGTPKWVALRFARRRPPRPRESFAQDEPLGKRVRGLQVVFLTSDAGPGARIFEIKGIVAVGSCRITDRDANWADPQQPLDDQGSVAIVERLVASHEQGGRPTSSAGFP